MPKKDMDSDQMMDDFEEESGLEFEQTDELDFAGDEDLLLEEGEEDEDMLPSVLYKGITKPKTDEDWRQLLLDASREGVPAYKISDSYREGALLLHHGLRAWRSNQGHLPPEDGSHIRNQQETDGYEHSPSEPGGLTGQRCASSAGTSHFCTCSSRNG